MYFDLHVRVIHDSQQFSSKFKTSPIPSMDQIMITDQPQAKIPIKMFKLQTS